MALLVDVSINKGGNFNTAILLRGKKRETNMVFSFFVCVILVYIHTNSFGSIIKFLYMSVDVVRFNHNLIMFKWGCLVLALCLPIVTGKAIKRSHHYLVATDNHMTTRGAKKELM